MHLAAMTEPAAPGVNLPEYSVSEIAGAIKRTVEERFGLVRVRGEISGFKRAASGHLYLALKDDAAVLDAVMWKGPALALPFRPEDGLEVIATGRLTTYPGRSKYQLVIERMEPAGVGALMAMLEERKKRLAAEGLFDPARKKPLPYLPGVVGVVTSPTGAVIRDILHRLGDRFPCRVLLWPVAVQGEGAAAQIAAAIAGFNALPDSLPRPDVLIVARGGGSVEDLWAFNEEAVVRAAAACAIPLISAVGHETDTTLIDFAADRRAPTPTAAAEMATPVRADLLLALDTLGTRLAGGALRLLAQQRQRLEGLARGLPPPRHLLGLAQQRADDLAERLPRALAHLLAERRARFERSILSPALLAQQVQAQQARVLNAGTRLARAAATQFDRRSAHLDGLGRLLHTLSYQATLSRGYAVVRDADAQLVTDSKTAQAAGRLSIEFADGQIAVTTAAPVSRKPQKAPGGQGTLF